MCEIVMLIFGFIALIRGKITFARGKEVHGAMARVVGLIMVLPFPLSFALLVLASIVLAVKGEQATEESLKTMAFTVEFIMVAICFVAAMGLTYAFAEPVRKKTPDRELEEFGLSDEVRERFNPHKNPQSEITEGTPRPPTPPDERIRN